MRRELVVLLLAFLLIHWNAFRMGYLQGAKINDRDINCQDWSITLIEESYELPHPLCIDVLGRCMPISVELCFSIVN